MATPLPVDPPHTPRPAGRGAVRPLVVAGALLLMGGRLVLGLFDFDAPQVGDCVAIGSDRAVTKVDCASDGADYRLARADTGSRFSTTCRDGETPLRIGDRGSNEGRGFCGIRLSPLPTPAPGPATASVTIRGETISFTGGRCTFPFDNWIVVEFGTTGAAEHLKVQATRFDDPTGHWDLTMRHAGKETRAFFELDGTVAADRASGSFEGLEDLEGLERGDELSGSFTC